MNNVLAYVKYSHKGTVGHCRFLHGQLPEKDRFKKLVKTLCLFKVCWMTQEVSVNLRTSAADFT